MAPRSSKAVTTPRITRIPGIASQPRHPTTGQFQRKPKLPASGVGRPQAIPYNLTSTIGGS